MWKKREVTDFFSQDAMFKWLALSLVLIKVGLFTDSHIDTFPVDDLKYPPNVFNVVARRCRRNNVDSRTYTVTDGMPQSSRFLYSSFIKMSKIVVVNLRGSEG